MAADIQNAIRSFGNPQPPAKITQEPFDYDPGHYRRLCQTEQTPDLVDLCKYADDISYQDLQPDLFLFLLPICLRVGQLDLMSSHESDYAGFVEQFSAAMAKHAGFRDILTPVQYEAVEAFMRDVILDKIDREQSLSFSGMRASPYSWVSAIGTFGTVFPSVAQLWREWWSMPTAGRACGVLQYTSALMYSDDKNPMFSPWTPDGGGGPPTLWETDGHIFDQSWLPQNVDFLRSTLTAAYVRESISEAASVLRGKIDSPVPALMVADFNKASPLVELRIEELLEYLSLPLGQVRYWATT